MLILLVIFLPSHISCGFYGNRNKGSYVLQTTPVLVSKLTFLNSFKNINIVANSCDQKYWA